MHLICNMCRFIVIIDIPTHGSHIQEALGYMSHQFQKPLVLTLTDYSIQTEFFEAHLNRNLQ